MPTQSAFRKFAEKVAGKVEKEGLLALDSRVHFDPRVCLDCGGYCCFNPEIILSPYDVYRLVKGQAFKLVGVDGLNAFVEKYCDVYIGEYSKIPIVLMPKSGSCPFLSPRISVGEENKFYVAATSRGKPVLLCGIHMFKPMKCRYYPLGYVQMDDKRGFVFMDRPECPGCQTSETTTVEDILGVDLENRQLSDLTMEVLIKATRTAEQVRKEFPGDAVSAVERVLYLTLYAIVEPLASSGKTYVEIAETQLGAIEEIPSSAKEAIKSIRKTLGKSA